MPITRPGVWAAAAGERSVDEAAPAAVAMAADLRNVRREYEDAVTSVTLAPLVAWFGRRGVTTSLMPDADA